MKIRLKLDQQYNDTLIESTYFHSKETRASFQDGNGAFFYVGSKKGTMSVVPLNDKAELVTAANVNRLLFHLNFRTFMAKTGQGKKKVYVPAHTRGGKKIPAHYRSTPN